MTEKRLLGELELNRIYQRDCIEGMRMIPNESITLTLTDIPYDQTNKRKSNGLRVFEKGKVDSITFDLREFLSEVERVTKGSIYIFCATEQASYIRGFFGNAGWTTRLCIWEKTNPSPANGQHLWLSGIEVCVYARRPKKKRGNAVFNEYCKNPVWRFPSGKSKQHPTEKPLKLFEYIVKVSSNEGDIVLDTCMGSGTTAIACVKTGRNFIGFETEREYIEIANQRLESVTCDD